MKIRYIHVLTFSISLIILTGSIRLSAEEKYAWTTAESGLRVRDNASLNAKKIGLIPYNSKVIILEEKGEELTIAGKKGKWTKVKSREAEGWVFGGFLAHSMETGFEEKAEKLYNTLKENKSLGSFMSNNGVKLVYHADNRCDGSTDGEIKSVKPEMIDKDLDLDLVNDGQGWMEECAENKITKFTRKFNLRKEAMEWMSYSNPPYYDEGKSTLSISSEQYHLQFLFKEKDGDYKVYEIKFSDEDPG